MSLEILTCNASSKVTRKKLHDQWHMVVPMVMLTEGVHTGSQGPVLYEGPHIAKSVPIWNHKPVVHDHAKDGDGNFVSVNDPDILNTQQFGLVLNTKWVQPKLKAEAWLNEDRGSKIAPDVMTAIEKSKKVEVSTGLFSENEGSEGTWVDGTKYKFKATDHQPDHLAALSSGTGACSIAKGAGLLANEEFAKHLIEEGKKLNVPEDEVRALVGRMQFMANELSLDKTTMLVRQALAEKHGKPGQYWDGWIQELYPSYVIYYNDRELLHHSYEVKGEGVKLTGEAIPVKQVTSYKTADGKKLVGNEEPPKEIGMDRKEHLGKLIGNGFEEKDREWLDKLPDDQLGKIQPKVAEVKPVVANEEKKVEAPRQLTLAELIANADPQTRETLNEAGAALAQAKTNLIGTIKANSRNKFTDEQLNARPLAELRMLAELAAAPVESAPPIVNYFGLGFHVPAPIANKEVTEEALEVPAVSGTDD